MDPKPPQLLVIAFGSSWPTVTHSPPVQDLPRDHFTYPEGRCKGQLWFLLICPDLS